jgi:xanthine dehydrogenase accessory factor
MSLDREALAAAVARHGRVARVVVAAVEGSAPREIGASMLVWAGGQDGTIGGGALEYEAAARARVAEADRVDRIALGPSLGQCCGGAVTLLTELWDGARLAGLGEVSARPLLGLAGEMPLAVSRLLAGARNGSTPLRAALVQGWFVEPVRAPGRALWVWGAGHVGRALVSVLAPLPEIAISWVDTAEARFPGAIPEGVTRLVAAEPAGLVGYAPAGAAHVILTYSHALDLELCHLLLSRGFAWCGLIGSATKWARFRSRLSQLGHADAAISRICCPIGQKALGKHPQAIAVGVAATLLSVTGQQNAQRGTG